MTLCRLILPKYCRGENSPLVSVIEGRFSDKQLKEYNEIQKYGVYYYPNSPSTYIPGTNVNGSHINVFDWVFVDCDLKDKIYASKEAFIEAIGISSITPTKIIDSGNGVHAYWKVSNMDGVAYLRFQRRLAALYNTDKAVGQIMQLMRLPGYNNTKNPDNEVPCELMYENGPEYTAEQLDKLLPIISKEDEEFCQHHYNKTYSLDRDKLTISDKVPAKWGTLLLNNTEVKKLWIEITDDRSAADFRLGHLMFANGFTKEEAASVLVSSAKALQRAPVHRQSYAENIIDKIWTFEMGGEEEKLELSMSVKEILQKSGNVLKGTRFPCHPRIDNTAHGFRLSQVIGLVAGSGVGKTAFALNMFKWYAEQNPDYHHFFVPLEQPANEIADRWKTMTQGNDSLHEKVHIISNYDEQGVFRHLSFKEIKDYILKFQKVTGKKAGCVVIDHIGALKKKGKDGENQDLIDICHAMKSFAVETNTLLVMQSQTSREKAGVGDLELNKDAAFGTVYFESYCDFLITLWQPVKRCHKEPSCPTVTAFKFCKIRHKKARVDIIQEDTPYFLYFDSETELMEDMTQDQKVSFDYFLTVSTNKRKADRKTEIVAYTSVPYKESVDAEVKRH